MISHPYGYPYALFMISGALFFLIAGYRQLDAVLETRRQRRLEHTAKQEEIRQRLQAAADRINNSGLD